MGKNLKVPFYILLFGLLTFLAAIFGTAPKQEYFPAEVLGAKTGLRLLIQPEAGHGPIASVIDSARNEILVGIYLLSDQETVAALKRARERGVLVKVMMEQHPFGGSGSNKIVYGELDGAGVVTQWSNPAFALTHQKVIIVDGREVCILNQNLTVAAFTKNREYNVCNDNVGDVTEAKNIFVADWERKNYAPVATNLIVSPDNSRKKLAALIGSAKESLDLEMEVLEDKKLTELLTEKAKTVPVRIIIPPPEKIASNRRVVGAWTKVLPTPYVHAKLLVVDKSRAYVGSINFSEQSLDQNRELGMLISQPDLVQDLSQTFEADFRSAVSP